ncbi:MAG: hypothetical protein ACRCZD_13845 [Phycicoccus sp.]
MAEPTTAAPKPKGAGDELNAEQVKAALLTVGDLPTGWAAAEPEPEEEDESTIEPASCQRLFDQMDSAKLEVKAKHKAKASFEQGGMLGIQLEEEVSSFADDGQSGRVKELAEALTTCPKVTIVDGGERTPMTMAGLSFPNLGDQTLAFRATLTSDGVDVVADIVFVAVGRNVITFTAGGLQPMPGTDFEAIARAGVSKVAAAAKS